MHFDPCWEIAFRSLSEIITKVKAPIRQLNTEQAHTVRRAVNSILEQAELPEPNITKEMWDALKSLKEDETIMVLPADKGHPSIVMDTDTYQAKVSTFIENRPYQLLKKRFDRLSDPQVVRKATYLEAKQVSIRGHLQKDQTLPQTAA